jgi:hypothetical protein
MNFKLIEKLAKLANNNPSENEANAAARKVCRLLAEGNFKFIEDKPTIGPQVRTVSTPYSANSDWFTDMFKNQYPPEYNPQYNPYEYYNKPIHICEYCGGQKWLLDVMKYFWVCFFCKKEISLRDAVNKNWRMQ